MLSINWNEWITLNRLIRVWANELADGTTEAQLWALVARAFKDGLFDHGGYIHRPTGRVPVPTHPELWRYLRPLGDWIFLSKNAARDLARHCNRPPPSRCSDVTKGPSQPSRPIGQLAPAPVTMIIEKLRSLYHRAKAAGQKPPNVKEASRAVQLDLEQDGHWASRRQIEKLVEAEEFKCLRWPLGKRRSKPGKK